MLAAIMVACGTASNVLAPTESDLTKIKTDFPDATTADLQNGFKLYKSNCGGCHNLHLPTEKNKEEWAKLLPEMFLKISLNQGDQKLITEYLFAKAE